MQKFYRYFCCVYHRFPIQEKAFLNSGEDGGSDVRDNAVKKFIEQQRPSEGGAWKSIQIVSKSAAYLDI